MWRRPEEHRFVLRLKSSDAGAYFKAEFYVKCVPLVSSRRQKNPIDVASWVVGQVAARICERRSVTALDAVQQEVRAVLGRTQSDLGREVSIKAADVVLSVDPHVVQHVEEYERRMLEEEQAKKLQELELERAEHFRRCVLADVGTAIAYWAMRHPESIGNDTSAHLVNLIESVAEHDRSTEPWRRVAMLLTEFVGNLGHAEKQVLLSLLSNALDQFGNISDADELRSLAASYGTSGRQDGFVMSPDGLTLARHEFAEDPTVNLTATPDRNGS